MNKLSHLKLFITLIQLALAIGCSECHNSDDIDIFERLEGRLKSKYEKESEDSEESDGPQKHFKLSELHNYFKEARENQEKIDLNKIRELVEQKGANLTAKDNWDRNVLHEALHANSDFEVIKYLVEQLEKTHPNQVKKILNQKERSQLGETPFTCAIQNKNIKIIQFLLDHGAQPTKRELEKAFATSIHSDNLELFEYLLSKGTASKFDTFILHKIAQTGNRVDLMEFFLNKNNPNINSRDQQGNTAIHNATLSGDEKVVKLLLGKDKTAIDSKNYRGETALHIAIKQGSLGLVGTLLRHGADPSLRDGNGKTPLELAEQKLEEYKKRLEEHKQQSDVNSLGLEPRAIVDKLKKSSAGKNYTTLEELESID